MQLEYVKSSGELSASATVCSTRCGLVGVDLLPPTTGVATLKLYDTSSGTATGTILMEVKCDFGLNSIHKELSYPVFCANGIYAELSGTGAVCVVKFFKG